MPSVSHRGVYPPRVAGPEERILVAEQAAVFTRYMATTQHVPLIGTILHRIVTDAGRTTANCFDYQHALIEVLDLPEFKPGLAGFFADLTFSYDGNVNDAHSVVVMSDPLTHKRILLDPTFIVRARLTATGQRASPEEIQTATIALDFDAITYEYLDPSTETFLKGYYLDYPLLYLNIFGQPGPPGLPNAAYMTEVAFPVSGARDSYTVQSATGSANVIIDGAASTIACDGTDTKSSVFLASTIAAAVMPTSYHVFRLNRYVF